tara:strand:- start:175 stop:306 length:132 start_codon:yes stop_codon:yes gene_type:complete
MSIEEIIEAVTAEEIQESQEAVENHFNAESVISNNQMIMIAFD